LCAIFSTVLEQSGNSINFTKNSVTCEEIEMALQMILISQEVICTTQKKQTPWPESANELYLLSDRRLSAKLGPIFRIEGCRVVNVAAPPRPSFLFSKLDPLLFLSSSSPIVLTRLSGPHPALFITVLIAVNSISVDIDSISTFISNYFQNSQQLSQVQSQTILKQNVIFYAECIKLTSFCTIARLIDLLLLLWTDSESSDIKKTTWMK
jgi:hypothetical protein